jgi:hypothetical protein
MKTRISAVTLGCLAALLFSGAAPAQLFRAYLAIDGNDANPCTLAQPCRLLPAALNAVGSGGEVWMLDSANYNTSPVNVTKSVSILAVPGVVGSVVAAGGPAILVETAGVNVKLRNLVIVPLPGPAASDGIALTSGAVLTVEGCLVENIAGNGISAQGVATVRIVDSVIRDNGAHGVLLRNNVVATISRSIISRNTTSGVWIEGNSAATSTAVDIADSVVEGSSTGVLAYSVHATAVVKASISGSRLLRNGGAAGVQSDVGASATLAVTGTTVASNFNGVSSTNFGAKLLLSSSTIAGNSGTGVFASTGVAESIGNNAVRNNGTNVTGTLTIISGS